MSQFSVQKVRILIGNMNYYVLFFIVTVCVALTKGQGDEVPNAMIAKAFKKCNDEFPLSDDEMARVKEKVHVPDSRNAKCLMSCMLKQGKIMVDGVYYKENALMMADVLNKDNPPIAEKAKQLVETCANQVGTDASGDDCEFAYKMAMCASAEAQKLGVKPPDF